MVGRSLRTLGEARAPNWSEAAEWTLPGRGRKQKLNRIASRLITRFNLNRNMVIDLLDDAAASDALERPADIIDHVAEGIGERKDFNEAAVDEMRRSLRGGLRGIF